MPKNLTRLFRNLDAAGPRPTLLDAVMAAVSREKRRAMLLRRLPLLASGLALSGGAAAYAAFLVVDEAARSGLANFASVLVTDTGTVLASWQDFLFSVVEALPVVPLAGACVALFVFFVLLRRLDRLVAPTSRFHTI